MIWSSLNSRDTQEPPQRLVRRRGEVGCGWGGRTRTFAWRLQRPLPYQLGYAPSRDGASSVRRTMHPASRAGKRCLTYDWRRNVRADHATIRIRFRVLATVFAPAAMAQEMSRPRPLSAASAAMWGGAREQAAPLLGAPSGTMVVTTAASRAVVGSAGSSRR